MQSTGAIPVSTHAWHQYPPVPHL